MLRYPWVRLQNHKTKTGWEEATGPVWFQLSGIWSEKNMSIINNKQAISNSNVNIFKKTETIFKYL